VAGRADAGRADDVEAEVALLAHGRLARVQPHADKDLAAGPVVFGERALRGNRARNRVLRARERVEERVALRVDLRAAAGAKVLAHDPPVVAHDVSVAFAELLEQARRALDVGEEECDRSGRKHGHGR
jgi:hypothetical protein